MKRIVVKVAGVALLAVAALGSVQVHAQKVGQAALLNTKHNLSTSGTGSIKATSVSETQTCVFCHVPHLASTAGPLWNRRTPANTYTPYSSTTTNAVVGQPDGTSLLCLSCHDGTIALGELTSRGATIVSMTGGVGVGVMPAGVSNIGIDLSNDHPVSFVYNAALVTADSTTNELANPATLTGKVKLHGPTQKMQCSSCHDAHDNSFGKFLVQTNAASALCIVCHTKTGWAASDHATKVNTYTGASNTYNGTTYTTPWTHGTVTPVPNASGVAANACENCHRPHTAPGAKRLLNYAKEEDNCLVCHNGTAMSSFTAKNNILGEYTKTSGHGTAIMGLTAIHDPTEAANVATKHVECVDCHNPHQAKGPISTAAIGNALTGPLTGVRGVTSAGAATAAATREDEVCYRCHGDTASSLFTPGPVGMPRVPRVIVQGNTRLEFATTNPSFHPVAGAGKSAATAMPSLVAPWTATSTMKCSHCHSNDTGPIPVGAVAGTGPNGPHASINTPLLVRAYVNTEVGNTTISGGNVTYNAANYALCYMCHSATSIMGAGANSFKEHNKHISAGVQAPCSTCHDPHGISSTQGTVLSNARLMNFNSVAVKQSGTQAIRWERVGTTGGRCYLVCHGKNHNPLSY